MRASSMTDTLYHHYILYSGSTNQVLLAFCNFCDSSAFLAELFTLVTSLENPKAPKLAFEKLAGKNSRIFLTARHVI